MFSERFEQFQPQVSEKEPKVEKIDLVRETLQKGMCAMMNQVSEVRAEKERVKATGTDEEKKTVLPECERLISFLETGTSLIDSQLREAA